MNIRNILLGNGREPDGDTLVARGVLFLVALALLVMGMVAITKGALSDDVKAVAVMSNAGGSIVKEADVKYGGVNVGKVKGLREGPGGAAKGGVLLDMKLEKRFAEDIPKNVTARVLPASVFGTSFVDLVPPKSPSGRITDDTRILQDTSVETLELQTILDSLDRVVDSLGPAELSSALGNLAAAVDGKGEQIGQTMTRLDEYLGKLNPSLPLVTENLDLLAGNLEAFEQYAPDLFEATDNALVAARTLIRNTENFTKLVSSGGKLMGETSALLSKNEKALVDTLMHTAIVVDALHDGRRGVVQGLVEIGKLTKNLASITRDNAMLRTHAYIQTTRPSNYTSAQCPTYNGVRGRGC